MGDHKIDLIHTDQHDQKEIKKTEIGDNGSNIVKNKVLHYPKQSGQDQKTVKSPFPFPKEPPNMKLPGY